MAAIASNSEVGSRRCEEVRWSIWSLRVLSEDDCDGETCLTRANGFVVEDVAVGGDEGEADDLGAVVVAMAAFACGKRTMSGAGGVIWPAEEPVPAKRSPAVAAMVVDMVVNMAAQNKS